LRPKGSRFDSSGQRPGNRPNNDSKPQSGATLTKARYQRSLSRGDLRRRPVGPLIPRGTYTQAFSLGYRIATLWAANSRSERTSLHVTRITAQLQKLPPSLRRALARRPPEACITGLRRTPTCGRSRSAGASPYCSKHLCDLENITPKRVQF
jgi:hypothetical protein